MTALSARGPLIRANELTVACQVERIGRWQIGISRMAFAFFMAEERAGAAGVPRVCAGTCCRFVRWSNVNGDSRMKFSVVINPLSRSVPKDAADQLDAAVQAMGHDIVELRCGSDQLEENVRAVAASQADAVIAWGGDGTLACTLTACGGDGLPVLALPGGTMNMLPKRLHGEGTWNEVLDRVLAKPETETIAAGEVDGQRFYIAALFGRLTGLAETREAVRKGELINAAQALVEGEVLDVETRLRLCWAKQCETPGKAEQAISAVAAAVALKSGPSPAFEVAAIDPASTMDLISTALDAMVHGWKDAGPVEHDVSETVTVHELEDAAIPATLDGEQVTFTSPVKVRLVKEAAKVLCAGAGH